MQNTFPVGELAQVQAVSVIAKGDGRSGHRIAMKACKGGDPPHRKSSIWVLLSPYPRKSSRLRRRMLIGVGAPSILLSRL